MKYSNGIVILEMDLNTTEYFEKYKRCNYSRTYHVCKYENIFLRNGKYAASIDSPQSPIPIPYKLLGLAQFGNLKLCNFETLKLKHSILMQFCIFQNNITMKSLNEIVILKIDLNIPDCFTKHKLCKYFRNNMFL